MLPIIKIFAVSLSAFSNLFLGLLVLLRNPKNRINITFFLLSLFFSFWAFCLLFYEFPIIFSSLFWIKGTYFIVSILVVIGLAFSFIFPQRAFHRVWPLAVFLSLVFLGFTGWLLFFTRSWIIGVIVDPDKGLQTLIGYGYTWWLLFIWAIGLWTFINLILKARRSTGFQRMQLKYIFYGYAFWAITINIPDTIIPLFFNDTRYFSISPIFNLCFSAAIAYAILKHRLMDIRLVIARTVSYTLLSLIIVTFYTAGLFVIGQWFFPGPLNGHQLIISIFLGLVAAYTFPTLKAFMDRVTVRIFFREHYKVEDLIGEISEVLSQSLDLNQLIKDSLKILLSTMHIDRGGIILAKRDLEKRIISYNRQGQPINNTQLFEKGLKKFLSIKKEMVVFDDLREGRLKKSMRKNQLGFLGRLDVKQKAIGVLFLGHKLSGDIYNNDDLQVLEILLPQLAVAIQNAQSYEEIKQFSEKLKEEVKRATFDLRAANKKLRRLDEQKDEFLSMAAHELRAPMSAIKGYLAMILEGDAGRIPKQVAEFLQGAIEGNDRLIRLVNNMLDVTRIEEDRLVYNLAKVKMGPLIEKIVNGYRLKAKEKKLKLVFHKSPTSLGLVEVDPDRLAAVVHNFVDNAIKYTEKGEVVVSLLAQNGKVRLEVRDTGPGIKEKEKKEIFSKFGRTVSSSGRALGTGLGLYISKAFIKRFGGKIGFDSKFGKGSTFWFELNGCKAHSEGIAAAPTEPSGVAQPRVKNPRRHVGEASTAN